MKIGDLITHLGRPCYLRGWEPMSIPDRRVELEDAETGRRFLARVAELEAEENRPGESPNEDLDSFREPPG
jgi:hypothetical protein